MSLQTQEAIITYDPALVAVDKLVTVVNETEGPSGTLMYRAKVKTGPSPASAR